MYQCVTAKHNLKSPWILVSPQYTEWPLEVILFLLQRPTVRPYSGLHNGLTIVSERCEKGRAGGTGAFRWSINHNPPSITHVNSPILQSVGPVFLHGPPHTPMTSH